MGKIMFLFSQFFVIHLYLLLYLFEKPLPRSITQIEIITKFLNYFIRVIVLKDFDFFDMLTIKFYFEHADWLLDDW